MTSDPIARFANWLAEAEQSELNDPNAVALATVDAGGRPSMRIVLLKGLDADGFVFYTNQQSRKADDLRVNSSAALLFHWKSLRRQVRVEGSVAGVTDSESDAYFATRGRMSRLGAWASEQSRPLGSRDELESRLAEVTARFDGADVPRPPHWAGYRVAPERIEFWSDGAHRLHDRELFVRQGDGWHTSRLYP